MKLPFLKMEGLGNDFVVIDDLGVVRSIERARTPVVTPEMAVRLCDRQGGVGADQLLWLKPPAQGSHDAAMDIFNADGSIAEMCGNGIRAVGLFLHRRGPHPGRDLYTVETLAGTKSLMIRPPCFVTADMGAPHLGSGFDDEGRAHQGEKLDVTPAFEGQTLPRIPADPRPHVLGQEDGPGTIRFFEVSMGNPHAVIFVPQLDEFPVEAIGPWMEKLPRFPKRTNVEFVQVEGPRRIRVRVWERGAGFTRACGTGACAAAVAALAGGRVSGEVDVVLPGGTLKISWFGPGESVLMEGPASEEFTGVFDLETGQVVRDEV